MDQILVLGLNALTGISLLIIVALGLTVTVGMMGVINLAHGELMMIGAFTVLVLTQSGVPLVFAMLAAPIVSGLVGLLIERLIIRWLYGRVIDTILATAGLSMLLIQVAKFLFGSDSRSVPMPTGSIAIGSRTIATYRLMMIVVAALLVAITYLVFTRTRYGLEARAATLNPNMAAAVGINASRVNMWTFVFGSALAGIAGAILAPFTTVTPTMAIPFMARAFMTVIVGGPAILLGTSASAAALGFIESAVALASTPVFGQVALMACALLLLRVFPKGISGSWGRAL
ncbi:MAG: branched-chain amino acid ABC transporter permease [Elainellaceae cyanobacterium]